MVNTTSPTFDLSTNTGVHSSKVFTEFCEVLGFSDISFRCRAESPKLIAEISDSNGHGKKRSIEKILECEIPTLFERLKVAENRNLAGYAIYWMPQKFKAGYNEAYSDIAVLRALIVDIDKGSLEVLKAFPYQPNVIVETSPGKFQFIWKLESVAADNASLTLFNDVATGLAEVLGGDLSAAKATQPFRAPGFRHLKRDVFVSRMHIQGVVEPIALETFKAFLSKEKRKKRNASDSSLVISSGKVDLAKLQSGEVQSVGEGFRHGTLLSLATSLFMENKTEGVVAEECRAVIAKSFVDGDVFLKGARVQEFQNILRDAASYAQENKAAAAEAAKHEMEVIKSGGGNSSNKSGQSSAFQYDKSCGTLALNPYSETAMVQRIVQKWGSRILKTGKVSLAFNPKSQKWEGQGSDEISVVKVYVIDVIHEALKEDEFLSSFKNKKGEFNKAAYMKACNHFDEVSVVNRIARSTLDTIMIERVEMSKFDSQAEYFFCKSGVLNLETGQTSEPKAEDYLLRYSDVTWNPAAACPKWMKFLREVFSENDEPEAIVSFMQVVFGYCLSGRVDARKIFLHKGYGANGKSKLMSALGVILGEYKTLTLPEYFVAHKAGFGPAFEFLGAKVEGSRVCVIDDFEVEAQWNESFVKTVTGDEFEARGKYEKTRIVRNRCKFHIGLNIAPSPQAENYGLLRRLCLIPYKKLFVENMATSLRIDSDIREEKEGIFTWAVKGFQRLCAEGMRYPRETVMEEEAYRAQYFKVENEILELMPEVDKVLREYYSDGWLPLSFIVEELTKLLEQKTSFPTSLSSEKVSSVLKHSGAYDYERRYDKRVKGQVSHFKLKCS